MSRLLFVAFLAALWLVMPMASAETLDQRVAQLSPHFTVTLPRSEPPFPVVIMLHGCGGRRPFLDEMARVANDAGAAVVDVDSYAHRRISRVAAIVTVCTGARLHGRERAGDLYAALRWARAQSWAAPARMAAVGWSHGGWTILDALSLRAGPEMARATGIDDLSPEPLEGLAATLIVYPYTGVGSLVGRRDWRIAPRSMAILAEHDFIVGDARGALERQRRRGAPLDIEVFRTATHAFEDPHAQDPRVRFNAAATAREHDMLRAMIADLGR